VKPVRPTPSHVAGDLPDAHLSRARPERELVLAEIGDGGQEESLMIRPASIEGLKNRRTRHGLEATSRYTAPQPTARVLGTATSARRRSPSPLLRDTFRQASGLRI
jgi:hypothetical protein